MWSAWRRARGWRRALRALAACCAALLCAYTVLWPARAELATAAEFPRQPPHALAHLLADFTNHPTLYPHLGSWTLEEEGGNYTHWWYSVSYECGARCAGRAAVHAQQLGAAGHAGHTGRAGRAAHDGPHHGPARAHRVLLTNRACFHLPLLPWPLFCEEWETDSLITPLEGGSGSRLQERWAARCSLAGCGGSGGGALADRAARRLGRLRALLDTQL